MAGANHKNHIACGMLCLTKPFESMSKEYYKAFIAQVKTTNWAVMVNNTEAIKKVINKNYWIAIDKLVETETKKSYMIYVYIGIGCFAGIVVLAVIVAVIVCLCRRRARNAGKKDKLVEKHEEEPKEPIKRALEKARKSINSVPPEITEAENALSYYIGAKK